MSTHYIDNSVFLEAMGEYKKECNKATEKGEQLPPVTDYIAECFMKTLTKNNNFYQIEHDDVLDSDEPFILIMHYSGNFLETETYEDEIFAGECTDMYWGD